MAPLHVYVDCAGTLGCATDRRKAEAGGNLRAHLWGRYWEAFGDDETVSVTKTKAHATQGDVEVGRTTEWERRGNAAADDRAKAGAKCHEVPSKVVSLVEAAQGLARTAAHWAGTQDALLTQRGWKDAEELATDQPPRPRQARLQLTSKSPPLPGPAAGETAQQSGLAAALGHNLRLGRTRGRPQSKGGEQWIIFVQLAAPTPQRLPGSCSTPVEVGTGAESAQKRWRDSGRASTRTPRGRREGCRWSCEAGPRRTSWRGWHGIGGRTDQVQPPGLLSWQQTAGRRRRPGRRRRTSPLSEAGASSNNWLGRRGRRPRRGSDREHRNCARE